MCDAGLLYYKIENWEPRTVKGFFSHAFSVYLDIRHTSRNMRLLTKGNERQSFSSFYCVVYRGFIWHVQYTLWAVTQCTIW